MSNPLTGRTGRSADARTIQIRIGNRMAMGPREVVDLGDGTLGRVLSGRRTVSLIVKLNAMDTCVVQMVVVRRRRRRPSLEAAVHGARPTSTAISWARPAIGSPTPTISAAAGRRRRFCPGGDSIDSPLGDGEVNGHNGAEVVDGEEPPALLRAL